MSALTDSVIKGYITKVINDAESAGVNPTYLLRAGVAIITLTEIIWWSFLIWMALHLGTVGVVIVSVYVVARLLNVIHVAMLTEDVISTLK